MDRLIVKNFGPLKDVDIELNKINLFIGENGSGKSVLAKLVTILTSYNTKTKEDFFKQIKYFKINYMTQKTEVIFYLDNKKNFELKKEKIFIKSKMEIKYDNLSNRENEIRGILSENSKYSEEANKILKEIALGKSFLEKMIKSKRDLSLTSQYIPAERNFVSIISKSLSSFIVSDIPLPRFFLQFSSEFEKAGDDLKELKFLNVKYVNGDGLDRHKVYFNDEEYLSLDESSSGIQSALPLYLTVKYFANKHQSIIIEEPEQNLFPKAQSETIQYIIEQVSDDNNLFLMTHSPYVLSTLNTLMMAYKTGNLGEEAKKEVNKLFKEEQWINPKDFSAYYLENGVARDIKGRTGLISENEIDDISDDMACDFEELLELYSEHSHDK